MTGTLRASELGFQSLPRLTYFVCGLPRCGSNLLCTALSGLAGYPDEHFLPWYKAAAAGRCVEQGQVREHLGKVFAEGAADGILGVKIMRDQLDIVIAALRTRWPVATETDAELLGSVFPNLLYIHLVRRDIVRQAISLVRARQSNSWYELQPWAAAALSQWDTARSSALAHLNISPERIANAVAAVEQQGRGLPELRYDFDAIEQQVNWLTGETERWLAFFKSAKIHPGVVEYEELASDYQGGVRRVLTHLRVGYDDRRLLPPALKRQSDEINDKWAERFEADRRRRSDRTQ